MQRHTGTQASSLVILASTLTILLQFAAYSFFDPIFVIWGISCLVCAVCCHLLVEQIASFRICFDYSFLTIFISLIIIFLTYYGRVQTLLPYTNTMVGIALINWLVPMLHCFIRNMLSYGSKVEEFNGFYRSSSLLFLFFYLAILIYGLFIKNAFPWAYETGSDAFLLSPFEILAVQIQDYLSGNIPLSNILVYLASRILSFVPYGFYLRLILRNKKRLLRFSMLLVLPLLIEILQYFIIPERCVLDDLIYALAGGFLGFFCYFLTNAIYRAFCGRDFLRTTDYRGMDHPLHF